MAVFIRTRLGAKTWLSMPPSGRESGLSDVVSCMSKTLRNRAVWAGIGPKKPATFPFAPDKARGDKGVLSTVVMAQSTHENFSRDEAVSPGSDRNFGLVMAGALALLSALNGWHHGRLWPWMSAA